MIGALIGITDGADPARVRAAVAAGLPCVLLRANPLPHALLDLPVQLVLHARDPDAHALATAHGFGLHLAADGDVARVRRTFRGLLSQSTHSPDAARAALAAGADWVFLSPIYRPTSKPDDLRPPLGPDALAGIGPVVALGGVTPGRVAACRAAGAIAVAVLGGIFDAADPAAATRRYLSYDQSTGS